MKLPLFSRPLLAGCSLILTLLTVQAAPEKVADGAMRGFGKVEVSAEYFGADKAKSSLITFSSEDAQKAALLGSKYTADLLGFGDLKRTPQNALKATVLTLDGVGSWVIGREGSTCKVLFVRAGQNLAALLGQTKAASWEAMPEKSHPTWLDCFDNAATGIWYGGGGAPVDITTDFPWIQERNFSLCAQPPSENRNLGPGVIDSTYTDWFAAECEKRGIPFRTLLWKKDLEWLWNRKPLPYVVGLKDFVAEPTMRFEANSVNNAYEPVPDSDPYTLDFRQRFAEGMKDSPNFMGNQAIGEIPDAGVMELTVVAGMPETKTQWHTYLKEVLKLDLKQVGQLYKGNENAYTSWDQVQVPIPRDFLGFNDKSIELAGMWEGLPDYEKAGIDAKWYEPATMPQSGWVPVQSNDPLLLMYGGGVAKRKTRNENIDYWMRRKFDVKPDQLENSKYLLVARSLWHGKITTYCEAYLNGKPLKNLSQDERDETANTFEVGDALKAGENDLVLCMHGGPAPGFITLGPLPERKYPYMTEQENQLWFDTANFSAWLRLLNTENILRAMRAGDPDKPLKMMATINMLDMSQDLCLKYGAYQHDTGGASGYWAPMTGARLSRTNGLPFSCEQGGPPADVQSMQAAITFYLMYGNDAADMVFSVSAYKDKPEVAKWVDDNLALMHCIGKMDLPLPPIGILRSSRATRLHFGEPWNWDMGRGTLQGIGRNFAYAEVTDILNGNIDKFKVVIDDGTVLLSKEEVEGLKKYVERGGTFVAQQHTGRHLPNRANAWPLAESLGLKVEPKLMNDESFHKWPVGKITFSENETLIPSLRGQTREGSGVAIDFRNKEFSSAIGLRGEAANVTPVAKWEDGSMAIADVALGKGHLIYLGSPFYLRLKDVNGTWTNREDLSVFLDEMLTGLGVPRESWTSDPEVWAEPWVSKNGVYDLYAVARMNRKGEESINVNVSLRRDSPITEVVDMGANGHPRVPVTFAKDRFDLPQQTMGLIQAKLFAAPRADIEKGALEWFGVQKRIWHAIPPLDLTKLAPPLEIPADILPLPDGWAMSTGVQGDDWTKPGFADSSWKKVKLGTFLTLGLPEETIAQFRKEITIPAGWKGKSVNLTMGTDWSYGPYQKAKLWINGELLEKELTSSGASSFSLDVTKYLGDGKLTLALEIDGNKSANSKEKGRGRPAGMLGMFYLQEMEPSIGSIPLPGPWLAAKDINNFTPATVGEKTEFTYLETRFTLPANRPGKRVYLEADIPLGTIILNGYLVMTPPWMNSLDISGMVNPTGENVLRIVPLPGQVPDFRKTYKEVVPALNLAWKS